MRVLITGSAGFVGSHAVEHLLANTDWDIVGIDSFRHRGDSMRVNRDPRYEIYCHDLTSPISERLAATIGKVDLVINYASESHVDRSITDPVPFCENNFKLMLNILEFSRLARPSAFVQVSTDEVYGAALPGQFHEEWAAHLPSNPYSASKCAQDALAISYWRTYDLPLILTRSMNMIGQRQDGEKFLPLLIRKIACGQRVQIHGNSRTIGSRFYLHSRNHADAILFLLRNTVPAEYRDSEVGITLPSVYNIVGDSEVDNLELARAVAEILGKELHYDLVDFHAARPGHDRRYALDGSKLEALGWKQPISFHESLKQTIDWTIDHPEWML